VAGQPDRITVIRIVLGPTDDRVCDICNMLLAAWSEEEERLVVQENCYAVDFGLVCEGCFDRLCKGAKKHREPFQVFAGWKKGEPYDWPY
jgi:hypothetical protein